MSIRKKYKKSDAETFLKRITEGPLTFGRALKSIRMCDDFSQTDFAKKLGISKAHLCDIEKERRMVSPARAWAWGKKLGYPPEQFVELALQMELKRDGLDYIVRLESAL